MLLGLVFSSCWLRPTLSFSAFRQQPPPWTYGPLGGQQRLGCWLIGLLEQAVACWRYQRLTTKRLGWLGVSSCEDHKDHTGTHCFGYVNLYIFENRAKFTHSLKLQRSSRDQEQNQRDQTLLMRDMQYFWRQLTPSRYVEHIFLSHKSFSSLVVYRFKPLPWQIQCTLLGKLCSKFLLVWPT